MTIRAAAFNQGKFPTIAFVNLASAPLGVDLTKLVSVLEKQLQQDFVPIWGYPAKLYETKTPKADDWQVVFLDDADTANALGYHDITKDGQPVSKVFVKTTLAAGEKISVTACHELLEMLIDPGAQLWAQSANGGFYAYEMCDAVEGTEYEIDGVPLSNFVYPSFFESWHAPRSTQFDHLKLVAQPFQTLRNGYQIVSDGTVAKEIFGSRPKMRHFLEVEDRTLHRSQYREARMSSTRAAYRAGSVGSAAPRSPQAAALEHAGKLLTAVAAMVDPSAPVGLASRRGAVWDPLPGGRPWELFGSPNPRGFQVWDPLPGGDPFDL
jgi:hypothetical protein